jgi:catechol 2,3-dioxygenase-like lactoylglutathione lyase family enzyme
MMRRIMIAGIDHVVLTCRDLDATVDFYARVLGMRLVEFGEPPRPRRKALAFGDQKINLHQAGDRGVTDIYARAPTPGSLDLCLLAELPLDRVIARLTELGVPVEVGPVRRTGARWPIRSVYVRDPDGNLVEIAERWPE